MINTAGIDWFIGGIIAIAFFSGTMWVVVTSSEKATQDRRQFEREIACLKGGNLWLEGVCTTVAQKQHPQTK